MWLFKITYNHIETGLSYSRHHVTSDEGEIDAAWDIVLAEARRHCEVNEQSLGIIELAGSAIELPRRNE